MGDLSNIEELRKRKELLLLEQEVARLERKQSMGKAADWGWKWVAPLALVGLGFLLVGLDEGDPVGLFIGLLAIIPVTMKLFFKRAS